MWFKHEDFLDRELWEGLEKIYEKYEKLFGKYSKIFKLTGGGEFGAGDYDCFNVELTYTDLLGVLKPNLPLIK